MKGLGWIIAGALGLVALLVWSQRYNWGLMVPDTAKGGRGYRYGSRSALKCYCKLKDGKYKRVKCGTKCNTVDDASDIYDWMNERGKKSVICESASGGTYRKTPPPCYAGDKLVDVILGAQPADNMYGYEQASAQQISNLLGL